MPGYFPTYQTPKNSTKRKKLSNDIVKTALLDAIRDPFGIQDYPVKIPDGKSWLSNSIKVQKVFELAFANADELTTPPGANAAPSSGGYKGYHGWKAKDTLDMMFFPGLNNMILIQTKKVDGQAVKWVFSNQSGGDIAWEQWGPGADDKGSLQKPFGAPVPMPFDNHAQFEIDPSGLDIIALDEGDGNQDADGNFAGTSVTTDARFKATLRRSTANGLSEMASATSSETAIQEWRLVSCGLKITSYQNATDNAGWWEAQRINIPKNSNEFNMLPMLFSNTVTPTQPNTNTVNADQQAQINQWRRTCRPVIGGPYELGNVEELGTGSSTSPEGRLPFVEVDSDMVNNPTYVTGKLRDMHKHIFKLRPNSEDHDFKAIPEKVPICSEIFPHSNDVDANASSLVDDTFDAIHIRIHGTSATKLMCHLVANQELVYDETSVLSRSATRNPPALTRRGLARMYNDNVPSTATVRKAPPVPVIAGQPDVVRESTRADISVPSSQPTGEGRSTTIVPSSTRRFYRSSLQRDAELGSVRRNLFSNIVSPDELRRQSPSFRSRLDAWRRWRAAQVRNRRRGTPKKRR